MLGNVPTLETRAKLRAANIGKKRPPFSAEHRAKMSASMLGKKKSSEAVAKSVASRKGQKRRPRTDEEKMKMSLAQKGKPRCSNSMNALLASHIQQWVVTTPQGEILEVENLKAFCRINGLDQRHMSNVAHGKENHHKQWKCRRA